MKKTIFLHIGANKTGTTAIQLFLDKNNSLLNQHGIHYCSIGKIWNAHFPMAWELGGGKGPTELNVEQDLWKKAEAEFSKRKENKFIISSENFILLKDRDKLTYIKKIFEKYDVHIVLFIRRQDLWIESLYLQAIKMGIDVEKFRIYHQNCGQELDYSKILKPWEDVFGIKNIKLINFDNIEVKSNLIEAFLKVISDTKIDLPLNRTKVSNETITRELAELLLMYNKTLNRQKRLQFIRYYNRFIKTKDSLNTKFFSKQKRIDFLSKFEKSNKTVFLNYFESENVFDLNILDYSAVMEYDEDEINEICQSIIILLLNKIDYNKLMQAKN